MQLYSSDDRAVRMIQALLAAADPLDRFERGGSAASYEPLAHAVLATLRSGGDLRRIALLLNEHAAGQADALALAPVMGFAQAALDWWANAEDRLSSVAI